MNELLKRRKRLHEIEVRYYVLQIISGLEYLHKHRVIHRDLKLGNLFIDENMELKLGDFGLAAKLDFDGERKRTICGTPNYIAPEVLEGRSGHSYEVDVWSLGVIIYTLIVGKPPFETTNVKSTYDKIKKNSYHFPSSIKVSKEAKELVQWILHSNPDKRPSLEDIKNHAFCVLPSPKTLHPSMLACPPTKTFINNYTITANPANYKSCRTLEVEKVALPNAPNTAMETERKSVKLESELMRQTTLTAKGDREPLQIEKKIGEHIEAPIHAKKWIDYTSKYGLGYVLSDGSVGVFYNDVTKIISDKDRQEFEYYAKHNAKDVKETCVRHNLDQYPSQYEKKVILLKRFMSYLDQNFNPEDIEHERPKENLVYVKKWIKTRQAKIFKMSNKVVQVYFKDKTEILLCSNSKKVTYTNKKGVRETFSLGAAFDSTNEEMNKRMEYTKNILAHLLQGGKSSQVSSVRSRTTA